MRFQINLSHQPFHNRKLFWLGFIALMMMLALTAEWALKSIESSDIAAQHLQSEINKEQLKLKLLEGKKTNTLPQTLSEDQVKQLQMAALLIEQRGFSWTAMLEEFER